MSDRRVTCTHHCSGCDGCFKSLEAFDLHRAGDYSTGRYCREVDGLEELIVATTDGACRANAPDRFGVVVYTAARSIGRAEEAFGVGGWRPPAHSSELGVKRLRPAKPSAHVPVRVAA